MTIVEAFPGRGSRTRRTVSGALPALLFLCGLVPAVTYAESLILGPGDVYHPFAPGNTTFIDDLTMVGGRLQLSNESGGTVFVANKAILQEGWIYASYHQRNSLQLEFLAGADLSGPAAGPATPFAMSASSFDTHDVTFRNKGSFTQSGYGALSISGSTLKFENAAGASYLIENDHGIGGSALFLNQGTFAKTNASTGTSNVTARLDNSGTVVAASGTLRLGGGGNHGAGGVFDGAGGTIVLGGNHVLGAGDTQFKGSVQLESPPAGGTSRLDVQGNVKQSGIFSTGGFSELNIATGGSVRNAGSMLLGGHTRLNGTLTNEVGAGLLVHGSITSGDGSDPSTNDGDIANSGDLTIYSWAGVSVRSLWQAGGNLVVDGNLDTYNGLVTMSGGTLSGTGVINGDLFVGGGVGTASFTPGHSPGLFTVNGAFTLDPGGELVLEVERAADGSIAFDRLEAWSIHLNGLVRFHIGAGISDADVSGLGFLNCDFATCSAGPSFAWVVDGYTGSSVSYDAMGLHIGALGTPTAPVPEPETYAMLVAGLAMLAWPRRQRRCCR